MFKKIKILIYFIIIFVLIYLIFINFKKTQDFSEVEKIKKEEIKKELVQKIEKKDTDGDGLEDWEEVLYGTDIEKKDTDGDGISDYDEVKNGKSPVIPGDGKEDSILKIKNNSQNIIGIKEQRAEIEKYKKKIAEEEKKKFELFLKESKKKLNADELAELKKIKESNKKTIDDLDKMAVVVKNSNETLGNLKQNDFELFFRVVTNNEKNEKISEEQKEYFLNIADIYIKTANDLKMLSLKTNDIKSFSYELIDGYKTLGSMIKNIIKNYELKKNNVENIKKYGNSINKILLTRQKMHLFISEKKLKVQGHPAKIFYYSF